MGAVHLVHTGLHGAALLLQRPKLVLGCLSMLLSSGSTKLVKADGEPLKHSGCLHQSIPAAPTKMTSIPSIKLSHYAGHPSTPHPPEEEDSSGMKSLAP